MNFGQLTEFCTINMGQSPDSKTYNDKGEGMPFYQGNADFGEIHPKTRVWCSAPVKIAHEDDILLSVRAPIGAMNIAKEECCIGRGLASLTPKTVKCSQKYLYYALQSKIDTLTAQGTGSTFKAISKKVLEKTNIPMYSLDEQKNITDVLNKVDYAVVLRRKQTYWLDQLVKSRFVELFGDPFINSMKWKRLKIKDAVTVEPQNGMYKPQSDYVTDGSGTPILRIDSFYNGVVTDFTLLKRLLCNEKDKRKYLLKEDDIIINRVNSIEYLGKCAHITGLLEETVYESNMMRIHFDSKRFNPIYVVQLLGSRFVYDQIVNHAKKAVNQASINQKDILDLDIYEPPLALQDQFAAFVKQVDKSKLAVQKSLDELETLKKSLMQQYFG